jgi:hypothetical protein
MKTAQPDLPLFLVKPDHPNVELLITTLRDRKEWLSAASILELWFTPDTDHNKRFIRALAEAAVPEILSGQLGYKWIGHATPEEVNHAANWLESQAGKMTSRAIAIRHRAHELFG